MKKRRRRTKEPPLRPLKTGPAAACVLNSARRPAPPYLYPLETLSPRNKRPPSHARPLPPRERATSKHPTTVHAHGPSFAPTPSSHKRRRAGPNDAIKGAGPLTHTPTLYRATLPAAVCWDASWAREIFFFVCFSPTLSLPLPLLFSLALLAGLRQTAPETRPPSQVTPEGSSSFDYPFCSISLFTLRLPLLPAFFLSARPLGRAARRSPPALLSSPRLPSLPHPAPSTSWPNKLRAAAQGCGAAAKAPQAARTQRARLDKHTTLAE